MMRKFLFSVLFLALSLTAFAQTAQEIIARMDERMSKFDEKDGVGMIMDIKLPILGTLSAKAESRGDKMRMEMQKGDVHHITWRDGNTEWDYDVSKNEIEVKTVDQKKEPKTEGDVKMFKGVNDGYDVSIEKETDKFWYLKCNKSKTNTEKDDPKTMNIVVEKGTYNPKSLSAKLKGVTLTMRDLTFGIPEKRVTFNPADYPTAKIVDKR
ncbi:MAG: hypothetical protein II151_02330 [Bacteroidales bacterium]|nr:hypothetical protein [Bacteroidales bacterium]